MKNYSDWTFEDKKEYVRDLGEFIKKDPRSSIEEIAYEVAHGKTEIIKIIYRGGHEALVNVTHNSLGAIFVEVGREIYGEGAHGRITNGI